MFSSWPTSALVVGVNRGSGNMSPSFMPEGMGFPDTVPSRRYSAHAEPVIYPLTMHSTSIRSAFRTTMALLASSASRDRSERSAARPIRWLGTMWDVCSNQKAESWHSTVPLSGIAVGSTTSKAEILSVAIISSDPPGSS